jgi:shikimate dehydrogenase
MSPEKNTTKTLRAGVVGWPIAQSLSPTMHSYWISEHGLDAEYVPLGVAPEEFSTLIKSLPEKGYVGVNVTIPHKQAAHRLCSTLDADARAAGAVNVLIFENDKIHGRNTDVLGFCAALEDALGADAARTGPVVVLGAGGAARAVILALARSGAAEIRVLNRTRTRAEELTEALAQELGRELGGAEFKIFEWGDWQNALAGAGLLVNTTSLGMVGKDTLDISLESLPQKACVVDIVYNPIETGLLAEAKARGHRTMDGLGMLMHQAVPAFEAWFGATPAVTAELRRVLEQELNG